MILDAESLISDPNVQTILIVILCIALVALALDIMRRRLYVHFKDRAEHIAKKMLRLETPIILMIFILGLQIVLSKTLRDYTEIQSTVNKIIGMIIIIIITYILILISDLILERWSKHLGRSSGNHAYEGIVPLAKSVINILLCFIALFFILQVWKVSITALLTSLGIVGVVLGFAFKDSFNHIFAGVSMILDDTFRKGELIELPDGEKGYVIEMNVRSTKLKNLDGMILTVPNGLLGNMRIKNYARPNKYIRVRQTVFTPIGSDIVKVEKLLLDILNEKDGVLDYPKPAVLFIKMSAPPQNSIEFELDFYINDYHDKYSAQLKSEVLKEAYEVLNYTNIKKELPQEIKAETKEIKVEMDKKKKPNRAISHKTTNSTHKNSKILSKKNKLP
ncbi:MAG: mechanosensitive ion channel family protein [Candidatus Nanoarchaeia archaeon]